MTLALSEIFTKQFIASVQVHKPQMILIFCCHVWLSVAEDVAVGTFQGGAGDDAILSLCQPSKQTEMWEELIHDDAK